MNRFILILSHRDEQRLLEMSESCEAALRSTVPKLLVIPHHIFLFQTELGLGLKQACFFQEVETKSSKCPSLLIEVRLLQKQQSPTKGHFE